MLILFLEFLKKSKPYVFLVKPAWIIRSPWKALFLEWLVDVSGARG